MSLRWPDRLHRESGAGVTSYYVADGLGSTTQLTDSAGAITDSYSYDVFGAPRTTTGTTANDFRYTGQQDDRNANRGLYFLRARSYDPALGRFLQKDPLPLANRYAYVGNNPANLTDPSGRCNDAQRYAHPEPAQTPVPGAKPFGPEKPNFDACSPPSQFPEMQPNFPFAGAYAFVTTNQCLRGLSKAFVLGAVTFLAASSGAGAAALVYEATGSALLAGGAGGIVAAGPGGFRAQVAARLLQGTAEDVWGGCL